MQLSFDEALNVQSRLHEAGLDVVKLRIFIALITNLVMQRCMVELLEQTRYIKKTFNPLYRQELRALTNATLFTAMSG
ncbi:MAG: hypothetical protein ACJA0G_002157 [Kangiellaceae bacterium]|jgi:hypothetical protein